MAAGPVEPAPAPTVSNDQAAPQDTAENISQKGKGSMQLEQGLLGHRMIFSDCWESLR